MPVLIILVAAVGIAILGVGYYLVFGVGSVSEQGLRKNFEASLDKKLLETAKKSAGSVQEVLLAVPADIEQVCFFSHDAEFDQYSSLKLDGVAENLKSSNGVLFQGDKIYPLQLSSLEVQKNPECIKARNGKITMRLESTGSKAVVKPIDEKDAAIDCTTVYYSGDPNYKLDIVFLADGYSGEKFADDVNRYVLNAFLATEPFKGNIGKLNFYRVDKEAALGCTTDAYIICDEFLVQQHAINCPHDYIIVLHNRNKAVDIAKPLRSSSLGNVAYVNTADDEFVAIHEFAHIFGKLADEYIDDDFYAGFDAKGSPNCDDNKCRKWVSVAGAGCFPGCTTSSFFRSVDTSIMRDYSRSQQFGPVNEEVLEGGIEVYG